MNEHVQRGLPTDGPCRANDALAKRIPGGKIVLCADSESLMRPWMMGLDGIDVESFEWVEPFSQADEVRAHLVSDPKVDEVWVVSSDDIESVNLAAAIRKDATTLPITLVLQKLSGSVLSRASSAGIKTVYTTHEFAERFAIEVQRRRRLDDMSSLGYEDVIKTIRKGSSRRRKLNVPEVRGARAEVCAKGASATGIPANPPAATTARTAATTAPLPVKEVEAILQVDPVSVMPASDSPIETTRSAVQRVDSSGKSSFVIGVFSGSGGVGKSVVSSLAGCLCARKGLRTLVIDADLQFGDVSSILGEGAALTLDEVLADASTLQKLVSRCDDRMPALIAAPKRPESSESLDAHIGGLLMECAKLFDVIIMDTATYWQESHAVLLEVSDCSLFLMDQRAASVRANNKALDLCQRMGVAANRFAYVLNRCSKKALFSALDISSVMNGAHVHELKDGGTEVEESCGAGCAEELIDSGNGLVSSLKALLEEVMPERYGTAKGATKTPLGMSAKQGSALDMRGNESAPDAQRMAARFAPDAGKGRSGMRSFFFRAKRSSRRRSRGKRDERGDDFGGLRAGMDGGRFSFGDARCEVRQA